jgi:hypothetical protein
LAPVDIADGIVFFEIPLVSQADVTAARSSAII